MSSYPHVRLFIFLLSSAHIDEPLELDASLYNQKFAPPVDQCYLLKYLHGLMQNQSLLVCILLASY